MSLCVLPVEAGEGSVPMKRFGWVENCYWWWWRPCLEVMDCEVNGNNMMRE